MTTMRAHTFALSLLACALLAPASPTSAQRLPVPVLGRTTEVILESGTRLSGELIEATASGLLIGAPTGFERTDLSQVGRVRVRQHDLTDGKALTWVSIGALASGLGMALACSQVEDTSCGGVFPAVALSFGLIGGLFALGITSSGWREVPVDAEMLRAYARFPQGAPPGFGRAP
jgi:hypothetical protein